jgi:hypothetical protein
MVTAALRSLFVQETAAEIASRWDDLAASLAERFPKDHWKKIWGTNLLERVNEEIKRRTRVVGIFPNDAGIIRLVGAVLLEHHEHWQLEGRRMFAACSPLRVWRPSRISATSLRCRPSAPERCRTQVPGCTDHSIQQHMLVQTKDLTRQSSRFIVEQRGSSAPPE